MEIQAEIRERQRSARTALTPAHTATTPYRKIIDQKVHGFSDFWIFGGIDPRKIRFLNIDSNMIAIKIAHAAPFIRGFEVAKCSKYS